MEYLKKGNLAEWEAEAKRLHSLLVLPEVQRTWTDASFRQLQKRHEAAQQAVYCLLPQVVAQ